MHILDKIISNFKNNKTLYIGEKITISEHMIQSAMMAEKSKSMDYLVCSCLLHDYGHFILDNPDELVKKNQDGKFLTRKYSVFYFNPETKGLKDVESYTDEYTRVGEADLPKMRRIINCEEGTISVSTMTLSNHELI